MLDAKDYKTLELDLKAKYGSRVHQVSLFYLIKWGRIESNITNLNESEQKAAKILFSALKQLTTEEREFLAEKYRVIKKEKTDYKAVSDRELAKKHGVTVKEYNALKRGIQAKLFYYLKDYLDELQQGEDYGLSIY